MAGRARELRYAVDLTADGELRDENGVVLDVPTEWSPEPGVVRYAAFVTPIPSASRENCSAGS